MAILGLRWVQAPKSQGHGKPDVALSLGRRMHYPVIGGGLFSGPSLSLVPCTTQGPSESCPGPHWCSVHMGRWSEPIFNRCTEAPASGQAGGLLA